MTIRDLVRTLISPGIVAAVVLACPAGRPVGDAFAATESGSPPIRATDPGVPIADHYQHLLSPAADAWEKTKSLPLTTDELRTIAGNVAPYLH